DVIGRLGIGQLTVETGGSFRLTGNQTVTGLRGAGNVLLDNNDLSVAVLGTADTPGDWTFDGQISGAGGLRVTGNQYGIFRLTGANTYTGGTRVTTATLAIDNDAAVNHGPVTITGGGTLALAQANSDLDIEILGNGAIQTDAAQVTLNGVISGSGVTLAKTGAGTLKIGRAHV